jgi:2,5-furandicarboxylate decarboxylase 1
MMKDFSGWIDYLRKRNCLRQIDKEVDIQFEIAAVTKKPDGQAAPFFKNVKNHHIPRVANTIFSRPVMAEAPGVSVERRMSRYLEAISSPLGPRDLAKTEL